MWQCGHCTSQEWSSDSDQLPPSQTCVHSVRPLTGPAPYCQGGTMVDELFLCPLLFVLDDSQSTYISGWCSTQTTTIYYAVNSCVVIDCYCYHINDLLSKSWNAPTHSLRPIRNQPSIIEPHSKLMNNTLSQLTNFRKNKLM